LRNTCSVTRIVRLLITALARFALAIVLHKNVKIKIDINIFSLFKTITSLIIIIIIISLMGY